MITETLADQLRVALLLIVSVPIAIGFVWVLADMIALWWRTRAQSSVAFFDSVRWPRPAGPRDDNGWAVPAGAVRWEPRRPNVEGRGLRPVLPGAEADAIRRQQEAMRMARGTIKKLVGGKGFGFIRAEDGQELFFHMSACANFGELREGQAVTFEKMPSLKGPRAENVVIVD
jgi:CspA family cold shock protein